MTTDGLAAYLVCRANDLLCALPVEHVAETMRPLPCEPVPGVPAFVLGASIIRGTAVPVVSLAVLMGAASSGARIARFVTLKIAHRWIALAVEQVVGVRAIDASALAPTPPLLADAAGGIVEAVTTLDAQFTMILQQARLVPAAVWDQLAAQEAAR